MPKKNVAKLRRSRTGVKIGEKIVLNLDEVRQDKGGDLDPATAMVVIRNRVKHSHGSRGAWGTSLSYNGKLNAAPADYAPTEKGIHIVVLTTVEHGEIQHYQSNPVEVS
jgi:hypothetical protein